MYGLYSTREYLLDIGYYDNDEFVYCPRCYGNQLSCPCITFTTLPDEQPAVPAYKENNNE